ncbi:replication initiator [Microbacterium sp. PF5]|uniref:replication initiator n=1 Tax=Microbacterium sp. PF5 TaxID=2305435 RepID=UPI00109B98F4|nr:replication initiator [Microbacterium sp. PF5]
MDPLDVDREFYDLIRARYCSRPYEAKPGAWVRCGIHLKAQCESCAELYRGDWAAIACSGLFDEDGAVVEGYRYAFLTLTAPSFGKVDETGAAIDPTTYDYLGQVAWNCASSALWRSTLHRLHRQFSGLAYFAVIEAQRRGVRHYHVVLRIPEREAPLFPEAIEQIAGAATTQYAGAVIEWGTQLDCRYISSATDAARGEMAQTIWYISKALGYALKSVDENDLMAKPGAAIPPHIEHLRALTSAARNDLWCARCPVNGPRNCPAPIHGNFGSSAQVVLYARGSKNRPSWSFGGLTRTKQREDPTAWMRAEAAAGRREQRDGMSEQEREAAKWIRANWHLRHDPSPAEEPCASRAP